MRLTGLLGKHVASVLENRLLNGQSEAYIGVIEHPEDKQGWRAEHVGKWIETACNMWQYTQDAALQRELSSFVGRVTKMQQPDGWLGSYAPELRFHKMDWDSFDPSQGLISFDLWCNHLTMGGLIKAYETTGEERALDAARRIADLIVATFGEGRQDIVKPQHDRGIGSASVIYQMARLYEITGEPRYLAFCRYIVRQYGRTGHIPIRMTEIPDRGYPFPGWAHVKHCEFELNLMGLGELHRLTGERAPLVTCQNIYDGGYAPQVETACLHGFKAPPAGVRAPRTYYDYLETCDVPTILRWFAQMAQLTGDSVYLDALEWNLYNTFLSRNLPDGSVWPGHQEIRDGVRQRTGMTSDITHCCHSMLPLGLSLIPSWCYFEGPSTVLVNLYEPSTLATQMAGAQVRIEQDTRYPWDGMITLSVEPARPVAFDLLLRIPGWCKAAQATVNGDSTTQLRSTQDGSSQPQPGTLFRIRRTWSKGDRVSLRLEMPTQATRRVYADSEGRPVLTLARGPLLLALTERLNPGLRLEVVSPLVEGGDQVAIESAPANDPAGIATAAFYATGITIVEEAGQDVYRRVPIVLAPYADAGFGDRFVAEFPPEDQLQECWLRWAAGNNMAAAAAGAVACADSELDAQHSAARAIDGITVADNEYRVQEVADGFDTYFNPLANCWRAAGDAPGPHWLEVRLAVPARLGRVVVRFADPERHPLDFRGLVSTSNEQGMQEVLRVTGCADRHAYAAAFPPVVTDRFRLVIDRSVDPGNPDAAEMSEIELYPPGAAS